MYHQHNPTLAVGNQKISGKCLFCPERAVWLGIFTLRESAEICFICDAQQVEQVHPLMQAYFSGKK